MDEILYLFRKRIDKYQDSFPHDICILSEDFGQRIRAVYEENTNSRQKGTYLVTKELREYYTGMRPLRGRDWSGVNRFYIPWNCKNRHWILLVVEVRDWTIWVYDSITSFWDLTNKMKTDVQPIAEYFPLLLKDSGKFSFCRNHFHTAMNIQQPHNTYVPQNMRT